MRGFQRTMKDLPYILVSSFPYISLSIKKKDCVIEYIYIYKVSTFELIIWMLTFQQLFFSQNKRKQIVFYFTKKLFFIKKLITHFTT